MTAFIFIGGKHINLARIDIAEPVREGRFRLFSGDAIVDENCADFEQKIVELVAVQGEWDCLVPVQEDDDSESIQVEPIIAWARTPIGGVFPVTAVELDATTTSFGLRRTGQPAVFAQGMRFETADEWLAHRASFSRPRAGS